MRKKLVVSLIVLLALLATSCRRQPAKETRIVVDMAGRQVTVPKTIHKVLGMSPVGTILIYTINPQYLAGWNYVAGSSEREFIPEPYRSLPVLGGWFGKDNTGNLERIIQAHPDVLISMGDPFAQAQAIRLQEQIHIPVFILDGRLDHLPDTYVKAGELLGDPQRTATLAAICRSTIEEITAKVNAIPGEKRRHYYYAEGLKGLETEPGGSMHTEALDFVGGLNVASVEQQKGYGHSAVSMEQVLRWNPEIIITGYDHTSSPGQFYQSVWQDSRWQHIKAVRNREVFEAPQYPFAWIDRPPSVNRIIGLKWLANLFYPTEFPYDMCGETRNFYKTFYQVDITDTQLDALLRAAERVDKTRTH